MACSLLGCWEYCCFSAGPQHMQAVTESHWDLRLYYPSLVDAFSWKAYWHCVMQRKKKKISVLSLWILWNCDWLNNESVSLRADNVGTWILLNVWTFCSMCLLWNLQHLLWLVWTQLTSVTLFSLTLLISTTKRIFLTHITQEFISTFKKRFLLFFISLFFLLLIVCVVYWKLKVFYINHFQRVLFSDIS